MYEEKNWAKTDEKCEMMINLSNSCFFISLPLAEMNDCKFSKKIDYTYQVYNSEFKDKCDLKGFCFSNLICYNIRFLR